MSANPNVYDSLTELWENMNEGAELTWLARRTLPEGFVKNQCFYFSNLFDDARQIRVQDLRSADQDLWSTLHLVWGTLINCRVVGELISLKEPQEALRKELWTGLQEEIGVFPGHVEEVI